MRKYFIFSLFIITISQFFVSCSQENTGWLSVAWHDLNARDNAYFLARERTKELDQDIYKKFNDNFNEVLFPYKIIDTNVTISFKDRTEDIIKKASLPITKHKNSHYVERSYILVGRARILRGEWKLAQETFRYVNSKGRPDEKHESMIWLWRLQMLKNDFKNAYFLYEFIKKQQLSEKNKVEFLITEAQYFRYQENFSECQKSLEQVLPLLKQKNERRARIHFIVAQLQQMHGIDSLAYKNYKIVFKNERDFDMDFYANLYMAQVASFKNEKDRKKVFKYYQKLLNDEKNSEYKDKIYYEMAMFEYKQKNIDKTIEYLEKSIANNYKNKFQKGATYLKFGEIYYYDKKNYEVSKLYYDSTVSAWDKNDKRFRTIQDRQKVLSDFVKNLNQWKLNDSLLLLADMDSNQIKSIITETVKRNEAIRKRNDLIAEAKRKRDQEKIDKDNAVNNNTALTPTEGATWYFYNPASISKGKTDFVVKWGKRKLEDHWRRSVKEMTVIDDPSADNKDQTDQDNGKDGDVDDTPKIDFGIYFNTIPFSPKQKEESNLLVSSAMFNVGRIYNAKLNEPQNAVSTFENLVKRYPADEKSPQALYYMYFIYTDLKMPDSAESKKRYLIQNYPRNFYAKLIENPNYVAEQKKENKLINDLYGQAFRYFDQKMYFQADSTLNTLMQVYPENEWTDKMKLFKIIILGKTKNPLVYKEALKEFIDAREEVKSDEVDKAKELLKQADDFIVKEEGAGKVIRITDVRYNTNTSKPHFFVALFDAAKNNPGDVRKKMEVFTNKHIKGLYLTFQDLKVNDSTFAIVVTTFEAMYPSKEYAEKLNTSGNFISLYGNKGYRYFWITDENYKLFLVDRNPDVYFDFFKNNY